VKKKATSKKHEQCNRETDPQVSLYLAAWTYFELVKIDHPIKTMTKLKLAKLIVQRADEIRESSKEARERWLAGDDTALEDFKSEHKLLQLKIGQPKRIAESLFLDIAFVIVRCITQRSFSFSRFTSEMQERGLPYLQNEAASLAEELSEELLHSSSDPWIKVRAGDCRQHSSTLTRDADNKSKPFIERAGHGWFKIRKSALHHYLKVELWSLYGLFIDPK